MFYDSVVQCIRSRSLRVVSLRFSLEAVEKRS